MAQIIIEQNGYDVPDSYMDSSQPTDTFGSDATMQVGGFFGKGSTIYRSILSFPLSDIPSGSVINSAKLVLYASTAAALAALAVVYRITQPNWTEGFVSWNFYNVDTTWITPGGDYTTSESASWNLPTSTGSFEITGLDDLVIDAIDNINNELHILLRRITESI